METTQGHISGYQDMGAETKILAEESLAQNNKSTGDVEKDICKVIKKSCDF